MSKLRVSELESLETGRTVEVDKLAQTFEYGAGVKLTSYNQYVRDSEGALWQVKGTVELPYTATGLGMPEGGVFVSVGDASLRTELLPFFSKIHPPIGEGFAEAALGYISDTSFLLSAVTGEAHQIGGYNSRKSGNLTEFNALRGYCVIDGVSYPTSIPGDPVFCTSIYGNVSDILRMQSGAKRVRVHVDAPTYETETVVYAGDIHITGDSTITLGAGVGYAIKHSRGSLFVGAGVTVGTDNLTEVFSRIFVWGEGVGTYNLACTFNRTKLIADNQGNLHSSDFTFTGVILGDYSNIPTPKDDAVIDVRGFKKVCFEGMRASAEGPERFIKSSQNLHLTLGRSTFRGWTKRQVIDAFFDTKIVDVLDNDIEMSGCTYFLQNKMTAQDFGAGDVYPSQSRITVKDNKVKSLGGGFSSFIIFQTPGGTQVEPDGYYATFDAEDNEFTGVFPERVFDVRGATSYKESGTVYRDDELGVGDTVRLIAVDNIEIEGIVAGRFQASILKEGDTISGDYIAYNRSPKRVILQNASVRDYSAAGILYFLGCDAVDSVVVHNCNYANKADQASVYAAIRFDNSVVKNLSMLHNDASGVKSGLATYVARASSDVNCAVVLGNSWQSLVTSSGSFTLAAGEENTLTRPISASVSSVEFVSVSYTGSLGPVLLNASHAGGQLSLFFKNLSSDPRTVPSGDISVEFKKLC